MIRRRLINPGLYEKYTFDPNVVLLANVLPVIVNPKPLSEEYSQTTIKIPAPSLVGNYATSLKCSCGTCEDCEAVFNELIHKRI